MSAPTVSKTDERTLLRLTNNPEWFAAIAEAVGLLLAAHVMDKAQGGEAA